MKILVMLIFILFFVHEGALQLVKIVRIDLLVVLHALHVVATCVCTVVTTFTLLPLVAFFLATGRSRRRSFGPNTRKLVVGTFCGVAFPRRSTICWLSSVLSIALLPCDGARSKR